ncbi:unnamed protein product [Rangifer tarandus platyrhynchus]|uniref:Uncharacterized protein n=1 Tax=Rangifer tarandus platyrhynchus TaxID=3082113 RepID=A0ABN8Y8T8_RANTA|nr:unnamed protein product [Rangifer tarandus platyrhynchus]
MEMKAVILRIAGADRKHLNCAPELTNPGTAIPLDFSFIINSLYCSVSLLCILLCVCAQLCLTLCDPMDCSLPGSSVYRILQARILELSAISFSRRSSQSRD